MTDSTLSKKMSGGCLCGGIQYRISGTPFAADHCHCQICRKHTGAVVASWMDFKTDQIEWIGDMPTEYESSAKIRRGFCSICGSTLSYRNIEHPNYYTLTIASLDNPNLVKPTHHIYINEGVEWLNIVDDCARFHQSKTL